MLFEFVQVLALWPCANFASLAPFEDSRHFVLHRGNVVLPSSICSVQGHRRGVYWREEHRRMVGSSLPEWLFLSAGPLPFLAFQIFFLV